MVKQAALSLVFFAAAPLAQAMPVLGIADVMDVTALPSNLNATDAFGGVSGNDKQGNNGLNLLNDEAFGGSDEFAVDLQWAFAGSSDEGNAGPFTTSLSGNTGTLTFDDDAVPSGAFAIALKAGNAFSLYYFDSSFAGTTAIQFDTVGTSQNKGNGQGLSHASLYLPVSNPGGGGSVAPTPTAALTAVAMLGLLGARRRRR